MFADKTIERSASEFSKKEKRKEEKRNGISRVEATGGPTALLPRWPT